MLGDLLGVQISAETARRLAEQMGAWMDVVQTQEIEKEALHAPSDQPASERCVMSTDGAMISLVHKQWVEVRTVVIGEPVERLGTSGETEVHVDHLSYFSSLSDASTFIELAAGEMRRRSVAQARQVCAVTDGAEWCQAFADRYRPDAVRILDFPHAAEHLSALLEACGQAGLQLPAQILSRCAHVLKHRGPAALLRMAGRLSSELAQQKGIQEHMEYLRKRTTLMQYPQFRTQGWPIGSGIVESANKLVVQARLKGPGMHWERKNVNPMLALRLAGCNDRWSEMWRKALACRSHQSTLASTSPPAQSKRALASGNTCASSATTVSSVPAQRPRARHPALRQPPSACSQDQRTEASPDAERSRTKASVCRSCGALVVHVRGHRKRLYCSDTCRTRACRARRNTSSPSPPRPVRIKHEALRKLPRAPITRPHSHRPLSQPFVKERADRCPCGTPVAVVPGRGHRPRLYCSDRCRQRAHRWRLAGNHDAKITDHHVASQGNRSRDPPRRTENR